MRATLQDLVDEAAKGREADDALGLDPELHAPFFDVLKQEREQEQPVSADEAKWLAGLTVELVDDVVRDAVGVVDFWTSAARQNELRSQLFLFVADNDVVEFERADAVAEVRTCRSS